MDALIESIVKSNPCAKLTSAQLQALIGLAKAAPVALSPTHVLFQKLSVNFSQFSTSEESLLSIQLTLLLCADASLRELVVSLIEAHSDAIESVIAPHVASLSLSRSLRATASISSEGRSVLSYLLLVILAAGETRARAKDLVEFVGADVESAVYMLVVLYADVCGVVRGVAPVVSGKLQVHLSLCIVQTLHELTFWATYEDLYSQLGIASHAHTVVSSDTEGTPLSVSAGPYRYHVGQIISFLLHYDFFSYVIVHVSQLAQMTADPATDILSQLRAHFLLLKALLTLTDQFVSVLRKTLIKCGILEKVCDPLLRDLSRQRPPAPERAALFLQCVDLTATLCFRSGESNDFWKRNSSALVNVMEGVADASADFVAGGGERMLAELVGQLVRLVVNSNCSAPAAAALQLWQRHLDAADKQRVACRFSNPKNRDRPVDIFSPAYDVLQPVFRVDIAAPAEAAAQGSSTKRSEASPRQRDGVSASLRGRHGRNRSRSCGRGQEGRKGHRGRSRSCGRGPSRGCRPSRRQRMKRRFQLLAEARLQNAKANLVAPEQLEGADADDDSSTRSSEEQPMEAAAAMADLSRWRRGPPPRTIPTRYICALSHAFIQSTPVLSSTGYVFDESVISDYLAHYQVCPISGEPLLPSDLVVDVQLKEELSRVKANFF